MSHLYPEIDEQLEQAIAELPYKQLEDEEQPFYYTGHEEYYGFIHEVCWYGIDSVDHICVLQIANQIRENALSPAVLQKMFELRFIPYDPPKLVGWEDMDMEKKERFDNRKSRGFEGSREFLEERLGLYYPEFKDYNGINFFNDDYFTRFRFLEEENSKRNAEELTSRGWSLEDLGDPEILLAADKFARDMWDTCVTGHKRNEQTEDVLRRKYDPRIDHEPPSPKHVWELGNELIEYYQKVIDTSIELDEKTLEELK